MTKPNLTLRLPPTLHTEIEQAAERNSRSMNSEVLHRLRMLGPGASERPTPNRAQQTDYTKTALRLPPDLHAEVHEAAAAEGRSYNAELLYRIGGGRNLRDEIAIQVLPTCISLSHNRDGGWDEVAAAICAYSVADAMLEARK